MNKDLDWLIQKIRSEREQLAQSFAEGKETDDENAFNDGKDKALSSVLRLINQLDEPERVETEVKSKQELIEKWESAIESAEFYGKGKEERLIEYMRDFVSDLNQLDEPEVLSQEWIDNNSVYASSDGVTDEYVYVDDLQNLLLPKQEEQKYNVRLKVRSSSGTVGVFLYKQGDEVLAGDNFDIYRPEEDKFRLTEQEIKDFDPRCWPFAVEVE